MFVKGVSGTKPQQKSGHRLHISCDEFISNELQVEYNVHKPYKKTIIFLPLYRITSCSTHAVCLYLGFRVISTREISNGSWCMGIKGEMSGTVCVTFTWYMYIWVVYSFCLFCCLFIIVTTQFVALYKPCKPKPKPSTYDPPPPEPKQLICHQHANTDHFGK